MNQEKAELLRFTTAGSVDDGKSTLIGRLLFDAKAIFEDQLEAIRLTSERRGGDEVDLSLLTDGLRAEREQGITIDVAYRYFSTPKRKFIIADTPGHIQYTRNMVTGASTANVALVLVDARHGVIEQTRRHAFLASLLQIPHLVVCINKMDLVDYKEDVYNNIKAEFEKFSFKLDVKDVHFIPISALKGDNIVDRSQNMPWFEGSTLLYYLENVHIGSDHNFIDARFPIQHVIRPNTDEFHDYSLGSSGNLVRLTTLLKVYNDRSFYIIRHHSGQGVESVNLDESRAALVKQTFVAAGIPADNLFLEYKEDKEMIATKELHPYMLPDYSLRYYNRNMRVEIKVKK